MNLSASNSPTNRGSISNNPRLREAQLEVHATVDVYIKTELDHGTKDKIALFNGVKSYIIQVYSNSEDLKKSITPDELHKTLKQNTHFTMLWKSKEVQAFLLEEKIAEQKKEEQRIEAAKRADHLARIKERTAKFTSQTIQPVKAVPVSKTVPAHSSGMSPELLAAFARWDSKAAERLLAQGGVTVEDRVASHIESLEPVELILWAVQKNVPKFHKTLVQDFKKVSEVHILKNGDKLDFGDLVSKSKGKQIMYFRITQIEVVRKDWSELEVTCTADCSYEFDGETRFFSSEIEEKNNREHSLKFHIPKGGLKDKANLHVFNSQGTFFRAHINKEMYLKSDTTSTWNVLHKLLS